MLKHIVMYRLKENTSATHNALTDRFASMRGKVPGLLSIQAGANVVVSERAFDYALVCEFDSVKELDAYQIHPLHVEVRDFVRSQITASHSVDFEF